MRPPFPWYVFESQGYLFLSGSPCGNGEPLVVRDEAAARALVRYARTVKPLSAIARLIATGLSEDWSCTIAVEAAAEARRPAGAPSVRGVLAKVSYLKTLRRRFMLISKVMDWLVQNGPSDRRQFLWAVYVAAVCGGIVGVLLLAPVLLLWCVDVIWGVPPWGAGVTVERYLGALLLWLLLTFRLEVRK